MAQELRAQAALLEDLGSIPSTNIYKFVSVYPTSSSGP